MTPEQLLTSGSAVAILAAIVIAFYTDRVRTKSASDAALKLVGDMWAERFADKDQEAKAYKAQVDQLIPAVAKMADELEESNRRDEQWRAAFERGDYDRRRE